MNILKFEDCSYNNKHLIGGKNSSLGELYNLSKELNFKITNGFAITTVLYDNFISRYDLNSFISSKIANINYSDIADLEMCSRELIDRILQCEFTSEEKEDILKHYTDLSNEYHTPNLPVAIRSSALAEDLPNASFAGQQDTYLNISGFNNVLLNVKKCIASLFNSRALSYRYTNNITIDQVKISVVVQKMVRSDLGSAGVAFSIDPETGYSRAIVINSSFGLGELVVSGGVTPDEIVCDKENLTNDILDPIIVKKMGDKNTKIIYNDNSNDNNIDEGGIKEIATTDIEKNSYSINDTDAIILAHYVLNLEKKYTELFSKKMGIDIEWAIDGLDKKIYILQARPETIHSNQDILKIEKYCLDDTSNILITGIAVGEKISSGRVKVLKNIDDYYLFEKGDILVTDMTTPDWEPIMKISSGIITNKGGRTCHAAIIAREMGLNAVVGTGNCTKLLENKTNVTLNCANGEKGIIYQGLLKYHIDTLNLTHIPKIPTKLMLNVGNPESSFSNSLLPNDGVGLTRIEFIISNYIKIHPLALIHYNELPDDVKDKIYKEIKTDENPEKYYVNKLARGISQIASAFRPNPIIVRFSDFKSNEYRNLIGGYLYEPLEENPMIGWRGAVRYYSKEFMKAFQLECEAIKYVRNVMGMKNVIVMIPFCRTPDECCFVLKTMKEFGLVRGENGLQVYLMCEIPSNVIEADEFSKYIDGVSIGGNDLLQLTLGLDRDNEHIAHLSNHTNTSYRRLISQAIKTYQKNKIKVGFCGQQPSDSLEFCKFLINEGIDSISVTPDTLLKTLNNFND